MFGEHPRVFRLLFFAQLLERFSSYGIVAILVHYAKSEFGTAVRSPSDLVHMVVAVAFASAILGSYATERLIGSRRCLILGASLSSVGIALLLSTRVQVFYGGLAAFVIGAGLFRHSIFAGVGSLYPEGKDSDALKRRGFTLSYLAINIGALAGPLIASATGEKAAAEGDAGAETFLGIDGSAGWRIGFAIAALTMVSCAALLWRSRELLREMETPTQPSTVRLPILKSPLGTVVVYAAVAVILVWFGLQYEAVLGYSILTLAALTLGRILWLGKGGDLETKQKLGALVLLLVVNSVFWALFHQHFSSLNTLALDHVDRFVRGVEIPATALQAINPVLFIALGLGANALWKSLAGKTHNPPIPTLFGMGITMMGLGYLVLVLGGRGVEDHGKIALVWLVLTYFFFTLGEIATGPIGLFVAERLIPDRGRGLATGAFLLSIAVGNVIGKNVMERIGEPSSPSASDYLDTYENVTWLTIALGAALLLSSRWTNRLFHDVK
ncbi:MAG: oligopeptide:H+ symporter [Acidobacteriota bacterium]